MPVNRSFKTGSRMARRRCSQWDPVERRLDQQLGIPLVTIANRSRGEMLERARLLVRDPGYPPAYVVNAVADLIARHVRI